MNAKKSRPDTPCPDNMSDSDEILEAAKVLVSLAESCCDSRPDFLEPCPTCNAVGTLVTHGDRGVRHCNGCEERVCIKCLAGVRYFCPLRRLSPPSSPLVRQRAIGVQSPKAEEKRENK